MNNILPAQIKTDFEIIANLAKEIWEEHYTPIIGLNQVEYMLRKFQSTKAIEEQVNEGIRYYLILFQDAPVGYFSFVINKDYLFLSKLYVLKSARGNQLGKSAIAFMETQVKKLKLQKIQLTVNKYNSNSIKAYRKMGFENIQSKVQDIQ